MNQKRRYCGERYGKNIFIKEDTQNFRRLLLNMVSEPMFLMLLLACSLYFLLGEPKEGHFDANPNGFGAVMLIPLLKNLFYLNAIRPLHFIYCLGISICQPCGSKYISRCPGNPQPQVVTKFILLTD